MSVITVSAISYVDYSVNIKVSHVSKLTMQFPSQISISFYNNSRLHPTYVTLNIPADYFRRLLEIIVLRRANFTAHARRTSHRKLDVYIVPALFYATKLYIAFESISRVSRAILNIIVTC